MNQERQNELISYAQKYIAPFNPNKEKERTVYAHIIEEPMDRSEMDEAGLLLYLEVFTKEMIETAHRYFMNVSKDDPNVEIPEFIPCSYVFICTNKPDMDEHDSFECIKRCDEIISSLKKNGGWIKGKLTNNTKDGIHGFLSLSYGLEYNDITQNEITLDCEATFVPEPLSKKDKVFGKILGLNERISITTKITENETNEISTTQDKTCNESDLSSHPDFICKVGNENPVLIGTGNSQQTTQRIENYQNYLAPQEQPEGNDSSNKPYKITIYKVGHGNTITIEKDGKCLLFDCGCDYFEIKTKKGFKTPILTPQYKDTKNEIINSVKPTGIIISHLHDDHYNLINSLTDENLQNLQFVLYPKRSDGKNTRWQFTHKIKKIERDKKATVKELAPKEAIPKDYLKQFGFDNISIFRGKNKQDPGDNSPLGHISYVRSVDDSGIILSLKHYTNNTYAVFPGDCSYYSWPDAAELDLKSVERLVIPHHGGHVIISKEPNKVTTSSIESFKYISENKISFDNLSTIDSKTKKVSTTYHKDFLDKALNRQKDIDFTEGFKTTHCSFDF